MTVADACECRRQKAEGRIQGKRIAGLNIDDHHITTSITTSPHHHITSPDHHITTSITTSPHHHIHHHITTSPHPSPHHHIATSHHHITTSPRQQI
jgi:hypothetical protein